MSEAKLSRRERKANAWQGKLCANCDAPLQGPFCHVCGQPEKTPIRDVVSLGTDAFDYLFDVDARLWRTLRDLFFRPGRLTQGYLAGKRMSFVRPLRIYLVTSAILFVVISSMADIGMNVAENGEVQFGPVKARVGDTELNPPSAAPDDSTEPAPVQPAEPVPSQETGPEEAPSPPEAAGSDGSKKPAERKPIKFTFNDQPWHPTDNPVSIAALPDAMNVRINLFIGLLQHNLELAREDPKRLGATFLRVLPQSLFVLLPLFALLLKGVLIFKRRLYMEHLMVAIHSHTFIYMAILAIIGLNMFAEKVGPTYEWIPYWMLGLTCAWIPLNLFLTQKRVYRQTWLGALFAFSIVGIAYMFLVTFTMLGALVMSLANL